MVAFYCTVRYNEFSNNKSKTEHKKRSNMLPLYLAVNPPQICTRKFPNINKCSQQAPKCKSYQYMINLVSSIESIFHPHGIISKQVPELYGFIYKHLRKETKMKKITEKF